MRAAKAAKDSSFCDCKSNLIDNLLQVTLPLLKPIIDELCTQEPQKRGATLALWLLERSMAPTDILENLRAWNDTAAETVPIQAPAGPRPGSESPLKTRAHAESSGNINPEEARSKSKSPPPFEARRKSVRLWSNTKGLNKEKESSDEEAEECDYGSEKSAHSLTSQCSPRSPKNSDRRLLHRSSSGFSHSSRKRRFTMNITQVEADRPPREEVIPLLRKVPAFSQLCLEDLQKLVDVCACSKYEAGENIAVHGAVADTLHIILEGSGKVSALSQVGTLKKGDFFGEDSLRLSACTNPTQVSAANGPITTLSLSAAAFQNLEIKPPMLQKRDELKARKGHSEWAYHEEGRLSRKGENTCQDSGRQIIVGLRPTKEEAEVIKLACANNKMITEVMQLSEEQCYMIADSVYCVSLQKGDVLFNKGDSARAFYIIREGLMSVLIDDKEAGIHLQSGTSFGEVALLYDSPRTATLCCSKESTTLWVLPRNLFKKIASLGFQSRIKEYSALLGKIPVINDVFSAGDLDMLADVIEEVTVHEGEHLCEIGRDEGLLFIIYSGECEVSKDGSFENSETLKPGDWVGEDQVVNGTAAAVSVRAVSEIITALVLDDSSLQTAVAALKLIRKHDNAYMEDHVNKEKLADKVLQKQADKARKISQDNGKSAALSMKGMERIGVLGEGSFGSVVLLKDKRDSSMYALKAILKEAIIKEKIGPAVQNERSVMSVLDSDFIVRLIGCYEDQRNVFFLLEPVFGGDLYDVFSEKGLFGKTAHAKFYIGCVTLGLEHMHQKRVIYRDLKLENCLLDSRGYAKLTDMGIAKMVIGKTYTICGTADYFAPETLRQAGHNRAVDWWAAGVLLFIMVVGRSPFDAEDVTEIYKNIVKGFSKVNFPKTVASDLSDVIKSLCRKKPEERTPMQKGGVEMLKEMPWFNDFDWTKLASRTLEAPLIPPPPAMEKIAAKKLSRELDLQFDHIHEWDGTLGAPG